MHVCDLSAAYGDCMLIYRLHDDTVLDELPEDYLRMIIYRIPILSGIYHGTL